MAHEKVMKPGTPRIAFTGLAIVCLIVLFEFPAVAAPDKVVQDTILSNGKKRTYYLFIPETVKAPAPLIVLLHGSGRNGMSLIDRWKDLATKEGFIIVGPDSLDPSAWVLGRDGPDFLHQLVEALKSKYPVNPRRVYLFGHSGGAVFALVMSTVASEYFAATAIHAGAFRTKTEFEMISNAKRKIPVSIWVGTNDQFFSLKDVRATRDAFVARDFRVQVIEMPGHDHNYYGTASQTNANVWEFLKPNELTSEPKYSKYGVTQDPGRVNKLVAEINTFTTKAQELAEKGDAKEKEFAGRDFVKDRSQISAIAQEQVALFKESADLWRAAAFNAETASNFSVGRGREYLGLIAAYNRKCADLIDAMRERAEAFLSADPLDVIEAKRREAQKRRNTLRLEIDELQGAMDKARRGS